MGDFNIIYLLAGVTLVLVLAIGFWQMRRAKEAKRDHEHSTLTDVKDVRHEVRP